MNGKYCDYIGIEVKQGLEKCIEEPQFESNYWTKPAVPIIEKVGKVNYGESNYAVGPLTKTIFVDDVFGNRYKVSVEDLKKVKAIWLNDAEVNKCYDILFRETLTYMLEDTKNIASCSQVISVAKNLERIGDQIQNIAEMIYYYVTGSHITQKISSKEMKTYKKEKKYKTDISNIFKKAKIIVKK